MPTDIKAVKVPVRDLKRDDVLIATNRKVVRVYDSIHCPAGKLHVELEYNGGHRKVFTYGRNTQIGVMRPC